MSTSGQNFVKTTAAVLNGSGVVASGALAVFDPAVAVELENNSGGSRVGTVAFDPSADGYTKHGAATVALPGTTTVTVSLADLTSATASSAGDTSFGHWNRLVIKNTGTGSMTIAPGASNPANGIAGGTTPTITVPAGGIYAIDCPGTGNVVDSTHKTIDITPAATTSATVVVSGS